MWWFDGLMCQVEVSLGVQLYEGVLAARTTRTRCSGDVSSSYPHLHPLLLILIYSFLSSSSIPLTHHRIAISQTDTTLLSPQPSSLFPLPSSLLLSSTNHTKNLRKCQANTYLSLYSLSPLLPLPPCPINLQPWNVPLPYNPCRSTSHQHNLPFPFCRNCHHPSQLPTLLPSHPPPILANPPPIHLPCTFFPFPPRHTTTCITKYRLRVGTSALHHLRILPLRSIIAPLRLFLSFLAAPALKVLAP